jgi:hypothetical protein
MRHHPIRLPGATHEGSQTGFQATPPDRGGEEQVARPLAKHLDSSLVVLHDRRIPGSHVNIDHIALARSGAWAIDAKRYKGKVAISRPLFREAKLTIAGRDKTKLVAGIAHQVAIVE